jgi:PAS domain S-box-containing protein
LEQRASEAAARERQVAQLLNNVPAAVASFDAQSRVRNCNQRYAELFGLQVADVIGRATVDYVPAAQLDALMPHWNQALAGKTQRYRRINVHPQTLAETWLDCSVVPEWDESQRTVTGLYAMLVDVTDKVHADAELLSLNNELEARVARRTAELARAMENLHASREELVRSQAKAGLAALVASVSHELSTPIGNSVLVASSLGDMARQLQLQIDTNQLKKSVLLQQNQALAEGSQMLMHNLARAQSLLKNFKQVSADQASEQRRQFDLAEVVAEVVSSLAPSLKTLGHRVEQDIPEGIQMDSLPGPVGQVIINLINNAYHHAFDGCQDGVLTISARVHASDVHLQVSDNGAGMPADVLLNLFEPFFSTKIGRGGTGLGMSIVDTIVRKTLGGSIAVRSVPGEGTNYNIVLPLRAPVLYS